MICNYNGINPPNFYRDKPETPEEVEDKTCLLCSCKVSIFSSYPFYFAGHEQRLCMACNTNLEIEAFKSLRK